MRIAWNFSALLAASALAAPAAAQVTLTPVGTWASGQFNAGAAEISAYDAASKRLFVVDGSAEAIRVLDVTDPTSPTHVDTLDLAPWGSPNSVDVHNGLVVVAVEAAVKTNPGFAVFFDANGTYLNSVIVGSLPDMVTFDPTGTRVLTANEGEPDTDYAVDPEGSVSIVDLTGGVASLTQANVHTAGFTAFNGVALDPAIRIFGPGATVAQDLEPEYVSVSDDSTTAWVTLQENNAIAEIDIATATVTRLLPLGTKDHSGGRRVCRFTSLPDLGTTAAGETIKLGGLSGLHFEGKTSKGNLRFIGTTDRGPNPEPVNVDGDSALERPFALPSFQPEWVRFDVNPRNGEMAITARIPLVQADGTPLSGIPNLAGPSGLANSDEQPCDLFGAPIALDPMGVDLEGIVRASDGTYWMGDEYRPSLLQFHGDGHLMGRYVPYGSNASGVVTGIEALPAVYAQRRANRGFEAVAIAGKILYGFVQSPLDNPDVGNDANSKASRYTRILAFDRIAKQTVGQYLYVLEGGLSDKIGDAVWISGKRFWLLERDDAQGPDGKKKVFEIDLAGATNLGTLPDSITGPGGTLERMTAAELAAAGIVPVSKTLVVDLVASGYQINDKVEGLARISATQIAVINDDDFRIEGTFDTATGLLTPNPAPQEPVLWLLDLPALNRNGLDASDKDGGILIRNWPVHGMYLPDGIVSYQSGGETYLVTANEGDTRDYDAFSEEQRVKDVTLDPAKFPNAAMIQQLPALGRLKITSASGDTDGDGDYDELNSFGARSISIWRASDGALVWDSGDQIELSTAVADPLHFNTSNEDNDTFDGRSDDKGPEPESVALATINGKTLAFVGLERVGGIMTFDVSDPAAPVFAGYANNRDFAGEADQGTALDLGPEGVIWIPAAQSPNGKDLLVVSNEISGTVTLYEISAP